MKTQRPILETELDVRIKKLTLKELNQLSEKLLKLRHRYERVLSAVDFLLKDKSKESTDLRYKKNSCR